MPWVWDLFKGAPPKHVVANAHGQQNVVAGAGSSSLQQSLQAYANCLQHIAPGQALAIQQSQLQHHVSMAFAIQQQTVKGHKPTEIIARDRFAELVRNVEDIQSKKYAYGQSVLALLDMRPLREKSELDLAAFCQFLIDNGVDSGNIKRLVHVVEGWGFSWT